jgi:hypothetical protein
VRFKSRGRGLSSIENKRNDTGLHFVLTDASAGNEGYLVWGSDQLRALIDWNDPVVAHGLRHEIKYVRLLVRPASSKRAQGADPTGQQYFVQLALKGAPHRKPKHCVGGDTLGLDLGPSTLAMVARSGEARLERFCTELDDKQTAIRRLQRQMDRQRRVVNPEHYDEKGRVKKKPPKQRRIWKHSKRSEKIRRRKASIERKQAAHRKSLHGCLAHQLVAVGNTIMTEKLSYKAWQKQFGRSVGRRAPGMFMEILRRLVESTGGTLIARLYTSHQTQPVLSWLRSICQEKAVRASASVCLWRGSGPTRSLFGFFGSLSRSEEPFTLSHPVHGVLGRSGNGPAGSGGRGQTTGE